MFDVTTVCFRFSCFVLVFFFDGVLKFLPRDIQARESGAHVFYMTCQDECELWLSPDSRDEGKRRIIFVPYGLNLGQAEWDR